jgi:hypothetical protein
MEPSKAYPGSPSRDAYLTVKSPHYTTPSEAYAGGGYSEIDSDGNKEVPSAPVSSGSNPSTVQPVSMQPVSANKKRILAAQVIFFLFTCVISMS